jgi:RNA-directed DNA polymerase
MAVKLVTEPIFEADFDEAAYGYRPRRSAEQAIRRVQEAVWHNHTEVIDADLSKYFDTIPHAPLMKSVARRISDAKVLHLIKMWLKAPVEVADDSGRKHMTGYRRCWRTSTCIVSSRRFGSTDSRKSTVLCS